MGAFSLEASVSESVCVYKRLCVKATPGFSLHGRVWFLCLLPSFAPLPPSLTLSHCHSLALTHTHSHARALTHLLSVTHLHSCTHLLSLTHGLARNTHSLALTHALSLPHSRSRTLTHLFTHIPALTHSHAFTHAHSLTLTPSLTRTHARTHSRTHTWMYALVSPRAVWSPQLLRGRRGTISTAKGSVVRLGVPWCRLVSAAWLVSAAFAWQAWHNLHCQGVGWTPWCPLVRFGLRSFCVAGVALSPMPRGRMYALASPGAVWSPQLLRGRRGTISTAKGSEVRAGVSWCRLASAAFVGGEAWHNLHCQRGRMYALVCPGAVWCSQLLRGRHGSISSAKGSDVRLGVPWCRLVLQL